eukprot:339764_1
MSETVKLNEEIKTEETESIRRVATRMDDLREKAQIKAIHKYYKDIELPLEVGLRISVTEITHIDTTKQQYGIKGYLVYNWKATDNDIKNFIKCKENNDKYTPEFAPNLHFVNDVEVLNYEEKDNTKIEFGKDGDIAYNSQDAMFINIIFTQEFKVHNFPFDVQDLRIIIT